MQDGNLNPRAGQLRDCLVNVSAEKSSERHLFLPKNSLNDADHLAGRNNDEWAAYRLQKALGRQANRQRLSLGYYKACTCRV